ncbi:NACHT domain-containing protein, partial [Chloroflexus sp.]|uniref:NACHT domain-containing protein n=1 Tax=Chloroflexus sp. TaxID=1904827 RepID=UPI00298F066D
RNQPGIDRSRFTRAFLLIGQAGSGKTTTLHFGALVVARALLRKGGWQTLRRELGLFTRRPPLPIYARLTELLPLVQQQSASGVTADRLRDALACHLAQKYRLRAEVVQGWIKRGGCLIMLDGLDETGDAERRRFVIDLINALAQAYQSQNRLLVASRPFDGLERLRGFQTGHLRPLDSDDIRRFLNQYFRALRRDPRDRRAGDDKVVGEAEQLYTSLRANPRLFDMATNPLLLASMAILVEGREPLPVERAKVYERLLKLTLEAWRVAQLSRNRDLGETERLYDESDDTIRRRLQRLARVMLEREQREITLAQICAELLPLYREHYPAWQEEQRERQIKQLFEQLALHSGVIQARDSDDRFSFSHFTLQEYLAARDFVERQCTKELVARWRETRWREAILLAIGHSATSGNITDAQRMLEQLRQTGEFNAMLLVAEALDEANARAVPELNGLREHICVRLREVAGLTDVWRVAALPDPRQRNRAATLLDRLGGDERPSLDLTRDEYWAAPIEPGQFSMGDDQGQYDNERPQFVATIERPYALARFPVTNRQYCLFLTAWAGDRAALSRAGPHGRALSADEAEAAVAAAARLKDMLVGLRQRPFSVDDIRPPRHWPGASYRPGEGNHPVVWITWYEATAFAWWAEGWLRALGILADGEAIRLPTEPEWERAAAYPLRIPSAQPRAGRREYPWGDSFIEGVGDTIQASIAANTEESDIGGTSVVGIFPHGAAACGAEELAGNVWEWCSTPYQPYPLADVVVKTFDTPPSARMVLRGGSFFSSRARCRCACRFDLSPGNGFGDRGFRLARLFSVKS